MTIRQFMDVRKASFCILFVLVFTAAVSLKDGEQTQEQFLSQLLNPASGLLDEDTAELLWTFCRAEFIHLKEEVKDLDLCFPQESSSSTNVISSEIRSLAQENIQKLIDARHPQLKQLLLQCLRRNDFPIRVSGEVDDSKFWHATNFELLFSRSRILRRNLGHELPQRILEEPKSSRKSPSPKLRPPSSGKASKRDKKKADKKHSHKETVILTAVITASVTLVVAALLFLCCCRCCGTGRVTQNDERPLLSLSMSDYSVGSSKSNYAFGNSIKEEKVGFQSSTNNSVDQKRTSDVLDTTVQQTQSIGAAGAAASSSIELKPPPGRRGITPPGLSPLKPPPGRLDAVPPEPPSFRPPDSAAAAPPPPAPPQTAKPGAPPPGPPPPPPPGAKQGPRPPPPPKSGINPPRPPPPLGSKARPLAGGRKAPTNAEAGSEGDADAPKTKLKPFFWDKVQADSDQSMVWNQLKAGSFQFNEEMIESLFGYTAVDKNKVERKKESSSHDPTPQYTQIIDSKKSQNLSILLRALNVTMEEVCDALYEGNELPSEFLQTLLKMAPTTEEELKLRLFSGDLSQLGPADRFLKSLIDIPFAFKRMEALLFMGTLQEELAATKESFATLEVACKELRNSRLFLKLLEAVLKTGNRMNDGTFRGGALAFKLDTLLKLSDVKGTDGKTTLLHFVVKEIIRSEGIRAARVARESRSFSSIKSEDFLEDVPQETEEHYRDIGLEVVSRLSSELGNVKKAAVLDADSLTGTTARLGHGLVKTRDFLNNDLMSAGEDDRGFYETVKSFVQNAEEKVTRLLEEEKKITALVKSTGDYFHGNSGRDEGLRLFVIVRDFLVILDKVCREVRVAQQKKPKAQKPDTSRALSSSSDTRPPPSPDIRQRLFPAISDKRMDDFSSDDESP